MTRILLWLFMQSAAAFCPRMPRRLSTTALCSVATKLRKTQLKQELKDYRLAQSEPLGKPAWSVFPNAVLDEIYVRLPTTKQELLDVKGIGPKKLDMYGDDILAIVAPYVGGATTSKPSVAAPAKPVERPRIRKETLTGEQQEIAERVLSSDGPNMFVSGSAGTGKSYLLQYIVQELQRQRIETTESSADGMFASESRPVRVGVCAPTGVAAVHVGGNTLHAFFGIGLGKGSLANVVQKVKENPEAKKRIEETDVLIIDECSMLSSDLLELLDHVARTFRSETSLLPFGGLQLVCFGDFFQLPPVSKGPEKPFCFESPVWQELGLDENMVDLVEVQRQDNLGFVNLLQSIRVGRCSHEDIEALNRKCVISETHQLPTDGIVPTRLYSLNRDVDVENEARLAELDAEEVVCTAFNKWKEPMPVGTLASVKKQMEASLFKEVPEKIVLKAGAQVMLTRNKNLDQNLVNGSRGVVVTFQKKNGEDPVPVVRFDCGVTVAIPPVEAMRFNPDGGPGCLTRSQVPLKLAWAVTVHKSQGTTLTRAMLDISSAFEFGQCYVALSRVRSLDGLWLLKPARLNNIKVSPQVLDFYRSAAR